MQWIIILLLITLFYFIVRGLVSRGERRKRQRWERSRREAVVPRRPAMDTEFAEEPGEIRISGEPIDGTQRGRTGNFVTGTEHDVWEEVTGDDLEMARRGTSTQDNIAPNTFSGIDNWVQMERGAAETDQLDLSLALGSENVEAGLQDENAKRHSRHHKFKRKPLRRQVTFEDNFFEMGDEIITGADPSLIEHVHQINMGHGEGGSHLHHRAEKFDRTMVITPLEPAKAHSRRVEPEWELFAFEDIDTIQEEFAEDLAISRGLFNNDTDIERESLMEGVQGIEQTSGLEFAAEVGTLDVLEGSTSRLRVLEPIAPATHVIKIGVPPQLIPAHDLPIHMEVSPRLTALAKDPYWAFVYWVLPTDTPNGNWELKVKNLSDQSEYFEHVDPGARRWYLHLNKPSAEFAFELGVRDEYGNFHAVLSSMPILLPPDRPSEQVDSEWLTIDELYTYGLRGGTLNPLSSAQLAGLGGASEMMLSREH